MPKTIHDPVITVRKVVLSDDRVVAVGADRTSKGEPCFVLAFERPITPTEAMTFKAGIEKDVEHLVHTAVEENALHSSILLSPEAMWAVFVCWTKFTDNDISPELKAEMDAAFPEIAEIELHAGWKLQALLQSLREMLQVYDQGLQPAPAPHEERIFERARALLSDFKDS